jgi:3-hydroxyisobutyrate dehydrogenase-like beta-hydroxyacid dehydrogenase
MNVDRQFSYLKKSTHMKPPIGFIGLGLMGAPMASRLIQAGYTVHIHNRTKEKSDALIKQGAVWNNSAADVAVNSEIVLTMLTNDEALRKTATSIQSTLRKNGIHIDCGTVSPALTSMLELEYGKSQRGFLHSPVLGSIPQATDGSLLLFVGGTNEIFLRAEPVLNILGSKIWRFPAAQQATNMKLIMNSFIAGMIATLSQALMYARKASVEEATVLDVLSHSALNSAMYQTKGNSILQNNFAPRFFLENLLKDANLFRNAAIPMNASTPIADTVKVLLEQAIADGFSKEDYSAIAKVF